MLSRLPPVPSGGTAGIVSMGIALSWQVGGASVCAPGAGLSLWVGQRIGDEDGRWQRRDELKKKGAEDKDGAGSFREALIQLPSLLVFLQHSLRRRKSILRQYRRLGSKPCRALPHKCWVSFSNDRLWEAGQFEMLTSSPSHPRPSAPISPSGMRNEGPHWERSLSLLHDNP